MAVRLKPLDISQINTGSVRSREFKLGQGNLASMPDPNESLKQFFHTLPRMGHAARLLDAAEMVAEAALAGRPMIWLIDAVMVDRGLSQLLVQLMRRGLVDCLVMNGEAAAHDYELAFYGVTAEETESGLADGMLGLCREPCEGINGILNEGVKRGFSIGECMGRGILERQPKYFMGSMLATGAARLVPTTVHLGVGSDGFHRYPGADGALLGKGTLKDANLLSSFLLNLSPTALVVTMHENVMLDQVFLQAYSMARNLKSPLRNLNLLNIGKYQSMLERIPIIEKSLSMPQEVELILPLLLGAVFSLVE
jgi:hypothetical protein